LIDVSNILRVDVIRNILHNHIVGFDKAAHLDSHQVEVPGDIIAEGGPCVIGFVSRAHQYIEFALIVKGLPGQLRQCLGVEERFLQIDLKESFVEE
jgi:hypothetical protein